MQKTSCVSTKTKSLGRQWSARSPFIPNAAPLPPTDKAPGQLVRRLNPLPVVGGWHLVVFAPRDRPVDFPLQPVDFPLQPVDFPLQPVDFPLQPVDAQLQPAGVPVRCGGVLVELARSRSATNSPGYPTSATNAVSDFDSCLPIRLTLLPCGRSGNVRDRSVPTGDSGRSPSCRLRVGWF